MELLETQDPEKRKLIESSDRHRQELDKELKAIKKKGEKMLTNALIIGGTLAITYVIISQLNGSRKKKAKAKAGSNGEVSLKSGEDDEPEVPSLISQIKNKVINQATLILLDLAKEKLVEYLESRKQHNENS